MSGVLIFCLPGSTTQAFFGLIVSFLFFALSTRTTPYVSANTDILKFVADVTLFLTLRAIPPASCVFRLIFGSNPNLGIYVQNVLIF